MNDENSAPVDLLRSCSSNDVLTDCRSFDSTPPSPSTIDQLRLIKTTVINSQPQDFVVTNGHTYRINRSPRGGVPVRGKRAPSTAMDSSSSSPCEMSPEHAKIKMLLKALDDANRTIANQSSELVTLQHNETIYRKRINSLEAKCGEEITSFPDVVVSPLTTMSRAGVTSPSGEECKSAITPSRQRNKIQSALRNEKELKVSTHSPSLAQLASFNDDINSDKLRSFSADTVESPCPSSFSIPLSCEEEAGLLRSSHDAVLPADVSVEEVIDHSPIKIDAGTHLNNIALTDSSLKQASVPSRKSALAARLGMSAKDRRSRHNTNRSSTIDRTRRLKAPSHVMSTPVDGECTLMPFVWQRPDPLAPSPPCTLFISHDNPQLGKTVADAISSGSMELMIESKSFGRKVSFVLATIVYSGPVEKVLISSEGKATASNTLPRGSQCLVCNDLRAFSFELSKDCETRVQGVIAEVNMTGEGFDSCSVDITSEEKLKKFFRSCEARVDVILSPHHSQTWYPYWEYNSVPSAEVSAGVQPGPGARKMAPQFRSKGIGYLRLGDDMSRFGTSFLSCDGCESFMDEGKGGVEAKLSSSLQGFEGLTTPTDSRANLEAAPTALSNEGVSVTSISTAQELEATLVSLRSSSLKWSDRVACFQKVSDFFDRSRLTNQVNVSGATLEAALLCLSDQMTTQKNPLVLKEATRCAGFLGNLLSSLVALESCVKSWNHLFLLCIHNLRHANRGVSEAAKGSLSSLFGSHLANIKTLGANIRNVIAGPARPGGQPASNAPNTARVLQWMIGVLEDYSRRISLQKTYSEEVGVVSFSQNGENSLGYTYNEGEGNPIWQISQCVVSLLGHKDVSVREASVTLCAQLFSLDILHCGKVRRFNLNSYNSKERRVSVGRADLTDSTLLELLPLPKDFESLVASLSADCHQLFLSSVEKKTQVKVSQRSIEYVNKLYSSHKSQPSNADAAPGGVSALSSGSAPPSKELKKSLSSLGNQKGGKRGHKLRRSSSGRSEEAETAVAAFEGDSLGDMFFEVKLSLKTPPSDQNSWNHFAAVSRKSLRFFESMRGVAKREKMTVGTLLSKVLPFTEETSSNDQSEGVLDVSAGGGEGDEVTEMLVLRTSAVAIRSMIRVKMADENDFKQAEEVMKQMTSFVAAVELRGSTRCISAMEVIEQLNS